MRSKVLKNGNTLIDTKFSDGQKTVQTATFHFLKHKFYSYDSVTEALLLYNYYLSK